MEETLPMCYNIDIVYSQKVQIYKINFVAYDPNICIFSFSLKNGFNYLYKIKTDLVSMGTQISRQSNTTSDQPSVWHDLCEKLKMIILVSMGTHSGPDQHSVWHDLWSAFSLAWPLISLQSGMTSDRSKDWSCVRGNKFKIVIIFW